MNTTAQHPPAVEAPRRPPRSAQPDLGRRVILGAALGTAIVSAGAGLTIGAAVGVETSTAAMLGVATGVTGGAFFGGLAAFATSDHAAPDEASPARQDRGNAAGPLDVS